MPRSARDNDQPGLWPLPETPEEPTARPPNSRHLGSASPSTGTRSSRRIEALQPEIDTLWRIDDLAAHLGVPKSAPSTGGGSRTTGHRRSRSASTSGGARPQSLTGQRSRSDRRGNSWAVPPAEAQALSAPTPTSVLPFCPRHTGSNRRLPGGKTWSAIDQPSDGQRALDASLGVPAPRPQTPRRCHSRSQRPRGACPI